MKDVCEDAKCVCDAKDVFEEDAKVPCEYGKVFVTILKVFV